MLLLHWVGFSRNTPAAEAEEDYIDYATGNESKYKLRVMIGTEIITEGKYFQEILPQKSRNIVFFQIQFGITVRQFTSTFF